MSSSSSMLGYNGVLHEMHAPWQILGNGYRVYNPVLMRFHSPDSMSPFGKGGINPYAYCLGNPINLADPSGHWSIGTYFGTLFGFKFKTATLTPLFVSTGATLAAAGVAVGSTNETQRDLAIAGAVILATGWLYAGRYAWRKRKIFPAAAPAPATAQPAGTPVALPAPAGVAAPGTVAVQVTPSSPTASMRSTTLQPRPSAPDIGPRRVPTRPTVPPPPPPAPPLPPPRRAAGIGRGRQRVSQQVRVANIRKGSADREVAADGEAFADVSLV